MKKRNLLITTAIAGLMVFSLSIPAMAKAEASVKAVAEAKVKGVAEAKVKAEAEEKIKTVAEARVKVEAETKMKEVAKAIVSPDLSKGEAKSNQFWWPEQVDLSPLRKHDVKSNPYGESFNYAEEFKKLDLNALKKDIDTLLTTSQEWWPADYGNYGPSLFEWPGTAQGHTAHLMGGAVLTAVNNALIHSIVGLTMQILIKHDACFGRSSRNMEKRFHGLT